LGGYGKKDFHKPPRALASTVSSNFMTTASFNDIRKKIQKNIDQSKDSILVSVAWLTSKDLLGQLIDKLESGCVCLQTNLNFYS